MSSALSERRNHALDFTKGALVLLMVLYHWFNYFVSTVGPVYTYLRFVTPSFIFLAGFLITNIYPSRYDFEYLSVSRRLFNRGIKLLALYTALNVLANLVFSASYRGSMPGVEGFFGMADKIYISGNAKSLFWVLLPISYLLLIVSGLFLLGRGNLRPVHISCWAAMAAVFLFNSRLMPSANLEMLAIGLLGAVCGTYPIARINGLVSHTLGIGVLYFSYTMIVAIVGVPFSLQVIGVVLNVTVIYLIGLKQLFVERVYNEVALLGQYSLLGYIAQIGILHILRQLFMRIELSVVLVWALSFGAVVALTIVIVKGVDISRKKSSALRSLYGMVFS